MLSSTDANDSRFDSVFWDMIIFSKMCIAFSIVDIDFFATIASFDYGLSLSTVLYILLIVIIVHGNLDSHISLFPMICVIT